MNALSKSYCQAPVASICCRGRGRLAAEERALRHCASVLLVLLAFVVEGGTSEALETHQSAPQVVDNLVDDLCERALKAPSHRALRGDLVENTTLGKLAVSSQNIAPARGQAARRLAIEKAMPLPLVHSLRPHRSRSVGAVAVPSAQVGYALIPRLRLDAPLQRRRPRLAADATQELEDRKSSWEELGVGSKLAEAMNDRMGIVRPNDLQFRAVPAILKDKDVILSTYTGSGKTLAGLAPLLERMLQEGPITEFMGEGNPCRPNLLIMAPTRELTLQMLRVLENLIPDGSALRSVPEKDFRDYAAKNDLKGMFLKFQPNILACTPKELELFLMQYAVNLELMRYMMLDEVDMLADSDKGRLGRILEAIPEHLPIQKVLASATALAHPDMESLISILLSDDYETFGSKPADSQDPAVDEVGLALPPTLSHALIEVTKPSGQLFSHTDDLETVYQEKLAILVRLLERRGPKESTLIFVNKKKDSTMALVRDLGYSGIKAELLSTMRKKRSLNQLTWDLMHSEGRVVVATDEVAARGLDYEAVTLVINFDLPYSVKNYLHRAGRAGRAGREGTVMSMVSNAKENRFLNEKLLGRLGASVSQRIDVSQGDPLLEPSA